LRTGEGLGENPVVVIVQHESCLAFCIFIMREFRGIKPLAPWCKYRQNHGMFPGNGKSFL